MMPAVQMNTFAIPVVLQNLPPSETLNQVVDNLNYLCTVFDAAFDTISSQINAERAKIESLQQRIAKAGEKTDLIAKYPNKSTTVFSHSSFPHKAGELSEDGPLISQMEPTQRISRPKYRLPISERLKRPPNCDTLSLFHSISARTRQRSSDRVAGLGRLPSWLDTVGDCLLFNTDTNPYLRYENIQNLMGEDGVDREDRDANALMAAPQSIRDKQNLVDQETYDIAYRPDLENVPTFKIMNNLGFDGLALDEGWLGFNKQTTKGAAGSTSIAPSGVANFSSLPELEALPAFDEDDQWDDAAPPGPPPAQEAPPPPSAPARAPEPKARTPPPTQPNVSKPAVAEVKAQPSSAPTKAAAEPVKKPKASGGCGRGALLDAIRAGKKLSSAKKERKVSAKAAKPQIQRRPSLMDHLKDRLKARNNLMAGKTDPSAAKSAIAPPPMGDDGDEDTLSPLKSFKGEKKESEVDKTGLGLDNVPRHMSFLMLDDVEESSASEWNSDD